MRIFRTLSMSNLSKAITLSRDENRFVTLLDDFARQLDPPVECRIAGGWVRDKVGQVSVSRIRLMNLQ